MPTPNEWDARLIFGKFVIKNHLNIQYSTSGKCFSLWNSNFEIAVSHEEFQLFSINEENIENPLTLQIFLKVVESRL